VTRRGLTLLAQAVGVPRGRATKHDGLRQQHNPPTNVLVTVKPTWTSMDVKAPWVLPTHPKTCLSREGCRRGTPCARQEDAQEDPV
jgi:hypothetical protein